MRTHFEAPDRGTAKHVALSPLSFLQSAASVYSNLPATTFGGVTRSWAKVALRVRSVAAGLVARGVNPGDTAPVLSPNRPELFELLYAVPLAGAVLNTVNTRPEPETIGYILKHSDCRLVLADTTLAPLLRAAFALIERALPVIDIGIGAGFAEASYDDLLATSPLEWSLPADEWQAITLNYTSGRPKGVIYHYRGAYLVAMGTVTGWSLPQRPTCLSVAPMIHCNGWSDPWAMAIVGGHMVFAADIAPETLLRAMTDHGVTHLGAAPAILQILCESPSAVPFTPKVQLMTAGALPPPAVLENAAALGLEVMQVYRLTETYGHISQCLWQDDWSDLAPAEQAAKQAMQGVALPMVEGIRVVERETGQDVPADGLTQGEIAIRDNTVTKGYYKDPDACDAAFKEGWFWSGDAAVVYPTATSRSVTGLRT